MRLNLGSGNQLLAGYVNVDLHCPAEIQGDIRELKFQNVQEVVMYHLLEHLGVFESVPVLARIRGWMKLGAPITVEVPDMAAIMANPGPAWVTDIYGAQSHEGEYHKSGFTADTLASALGAAGFSDVLVHSFRSPNPNRPGMPCIEATGRA